jgi:sugar phosphate isomerase/epimerase
MKDRCMAIKLAFNTTACPLWSLGQVIEQAKAYGYAGIVLDTAPQAADGSKAATATLCDPRGADPDQVRAVFEAAAIQPVCLATPTCLHYRDRSRAAAAVAQAGRDLELAAQIGCPYVRIFGGDVEAGQNERAVITRIAERAKGLADHAGELGVQLLFENGGGFARAQAWWWLLDIIANPMVGLAWNVASAAAAGEMAGVSVPTLHSRIRLAMAGDFKAGDPATPLPLGDGDVGIEHFVKRLLGIGYDGYICVEWDRLQNLALASEEEYLPAAQQRLQGWLDAVAKSIEDAKPKPKPARPIKAAG